MSTPVCHDFKSVRSDAVKRLPSIFMLVPIMFYLAIFGGGWLAFSSWMNIKKLSAERDNFALLEAEEETKKSNYATDEMAVFIEKQRAEKLAIWVEGTRVVQPITVAINRSIGADTSIAELLMQRSAELPAQINLSIDINKGNVQDVIRIQNAINSLNYRPYNSQQIKNGENLEFSTMLVWSNQ